ncbi:hypothetical protein CF65_00887 [Aggregatibacter actinomycetemcomitans HK1651]|nr:hypothetical protein CF65_00887 [Aggregatibacter actinomycetemcomitans HK1651]
MLCNNCTNCAMALGESNVALIRVFSFYRDGAPNYAHTGLNEWRLKS